MQTNPPFTSATAKEWDRVRAAFASSIMVDTALASLAQNLDGPEWPLRGGSETPADYIDLSFEEVGEFLALKGQPPERLDALIAILGETLAFDDPFGEMVEQSVANERQDNPVPKNLAKLGIPESFPITLTALSAETVEFCTLEQLATLGEFAIFAQSMSQNVIVGGDFKRLLNALSHIDEAAIARFLPSRPGQRGLFLVETVAHLLRSLSDAARPAVSAAPDTLPAPLQARLALALAYFPEEAHTLKRELGSGVSGGRYLASLSDPQMETVVAAVLGKAWGISAPKPKKVSWFARLWGTERT